MWNPGSAAVVARGKIILRRRTRRQAAQRLATRRGHAALQQQRLRLRPGSHAAERSITQPERQGFLQRVLHPAFQPQGVLQRPGKGHQQHMPRPPALAAHRSQAADTGQQALRAATGSSHTAAHSFQPLTRLVIRGFDFLVTQLSNYQYHTIQLEYLLSLL